jgi:hypothetical protein
MTVYEMREHVLRLVEVHAIRRGWCKYPAQAWAVREFDEIEIAPIKSALSYAAALHEIGHIKGRFQASQRSMVCERWAWRWAKKNALIWTRAMENYRLRSLQIVETRIKSDPSLKRQTAMIEVIGGGVN